MGFQCAPAIAAKYAVVIASDYHGSADKSDHLDNPLVDAKNIISALSKTEVRLLSFEPEPDIIKIRDFLRNIDKKIGPNDIIFLYFAGHGVQYLGENYFLMSDGHSLMRFVDIIAPIAKHAKGVIAVVDACRENYWDLKAPAEQLDVADGSFRPSRSVSVAELSAARGLNQMTDLSGLNTIVFFSTEPGNIADDGAKGEGSLFASTMAKEVLRRQSLNELILAVTKRVNKDSNENKKNKKTMESQTPWSQGILPFDVYLAGTPWPPPP